MKITGPIGAKTLAVSEAKPKTTYIVRFQDTGSGRITVIDAITDPSGNAVMAAPINYALNGLKGSAQIVGEKGIIDFTNDWSDEGDLIMNEVTHVVIQQQEATPVPAFQPSPEVTRHQTKEVVCITSGRAER
jgi:hypothetical protein